MNIQHSTVGQTSVVVKDLWLEDKDLRSEDKDLWLEDKDLRSKDKDLRLKDKDLRSKDLSVYANWTTVGTLFAIKNKNNVRAMKH